MTSVPPASPWYRATPDAAQVPPEVAERALEWLLALQDDGACPAIKEAWQRWRTEHPDHERAWQRIESVRCRLEPLASPFNAAVAQATLAPPPAPHRRRAVKAMAVMIAGGAAAWGVEAFAPWRQWASDYRTGVGERRTWVLEDGTRVLLNTDSAIDVRFDAAQRRVALLAGEIVIATAADSSPNARPFLVETAEGMARALGTVYRVRRFDGGTALDVFEGAVEVRPRDNPGASLVVRAGFGTRYSSRTVEPPSRADESVIAWRDGFIVARGMRLDDFLAELGRYTSDALSCDPAIAGVRVSGSFPIASIDKVLRNVGTTLGVRIEIRSRFWGGKAVRLTPLPAAQRI
ncbi:histidine kinase [Bordetella genomosp. 9]|uniref:FecR domain-containing protein n=1 Tax=Bordetella genomosp. 9 TaxID=1416803 RepID=UPI000A29732C|nr:FecR domain-containing protein [Bordetella genomosp. 9]ARP89156.1 histidine kinase [Bordetella genomosp. 9]